MKDKAIAIYSEIEHLIEILRLECGKKKAKELQARVEKVTFSMFLCALRADYEKVEQELLQLCSHLRYEELSVLVQQVDVYKKDYIGHAAKVRPFVAGFDKIESSLKSAKKLLGDKRSCLDIESETVYVELGNAIAQINECLTNLKEQYELWKQEVISEKKTGWRSKVSAGIVIGVVVSVISFIATETLRAYKEEFKSFCSHVQMVLMGTECAEKSNPATPERDGEGVVGLHE